LIKNHVKLPIFGKKINPIRPTSKSISRIHYLKEQFKFRPESYILDKNTRSTGQG